MKSTLLLMLIFTMADLRAQWNSLVEAERSFARTSVAAGTKDAFLSVLADDSIIFRPQAVSGRKWMSDSPGTSSRLTWEPEFADISRAGDLGYTTGPWELRPNPSGPPAAFGHYVTLWRKQSTGTWKVELDIGISHGQAKNQDRVDSPPLSKTTESALPKTATDQAKTVVARADKTASASLADYFAPDVRLYRDGSFPAIGKMPAEQLLKDRKGNLNCSPLDLRIAASADLAYAYGTTEFKPQGESKPLEYANYLRIWKKQRDGSWKIVLDLLSPAPKPLPA
jgi:ketosteroid isomerase-like protein